MHPQLLVQFLPVAALLHRIHHDVFCGHEGQLIHHPGTDHLVVHHKAVAHVHHNVQDSVHPQEGFCHGDPLVGRVIQGALKELHAGGDGRIQHVYHNVPGKGVNPLAPHGIPLVRHGRGTDLMLLEGLLHFLKAGQEAHIVGKLAGGLGNAAEHGQHLIVHLSGIGLTGNRHNLVKAHGLGNVLLHRIDLRRVPVKQLHKGSLGAGGSLAAQHGQGRQAVLQLLIVHGQFIQPQRGSLAHGGQLSRLQMGISQAGQCLVLFRKVCQQAHNIQQLSPQDVHAFPHDDDVRVVPHITGGCAQMDNPCRPGALKPVGVHVAHHVMAAFLFPTLSILIIDVFPVGFQLGNLVIGNVQSLILLCPRQSDPQLPPGAELVILREDVLHFTACVAGGKRADIAVMRHKAFLRLILRNRRRKPVAGRYLFTIHYNEGSR